MLQTIWSQSSPYRNPAGRSGACANESAHEPRLKVQPRRHRSEDAAPGRVTLNEMSASQDQAELSRHSGRFSRQSGQFAVCPQSDHQAQLGNLPTCLDELRAVVKSKERGCMRLVLKMLKFLIGIMLLGILGFSGWLTFSPSDGLLSASANAAKMV